MFKVVDKKVWAFDVEWVPDVRAGKLIYNLPPDMEDLDVMKKMWEAGGATEDNPTPYLKTTICRVVSLSMVTRHVEGDNVKVELHSLPSIPAEEKESDERYIIKTFLDTIGKHKPQIIGYNSISADLKILIQRGIANGICAEDFAKRPDKPWEGTDYFSEHSDKNIDLMRIVGGWGKSTPSLNEISLVSGIPGKMDVSGEEVAPLWLEGRIDEIIRYNEFDALTTYLLWLRFAHFGGFFNDDQYEVEQNLIKKLIIKESEKDERKHLKKYLDEWERVKSFN